MLGRAERIGVGLAAVTAAALALIGVTWVLNPGSNAEVFGVSLVGPEHAYGRVKGFEDLFLAVLVGLAVLRRDLTEVRRIMAVGMVLVVAGDLLAALLAGVRGLEHLWLHGLFFVLMAAAIVLLSQRGAQRTTEKGFVGHGEKVA